MAILNKPLGTSQNLLRIVGIGASAGGLEALEQFFKHVPPNINIAFIAVLHLGSDSVIVELLQSSIAIKVLQITDGMEIQPNHVYVIPPHKTLSIMKGVLHLSDLKPGVHHNIDSFFSSLAKDQLDRAVGIVLSGMGNDGTLGLSSIIEKGGLTLTQDPLDAKFDSMPRSAIAAKVVNIVAPAEKLLERVINSYKYTSTAQAYEIDKKLSKEVKEAITKIIHLLHTQTGFDFSQYKFGTIYRRIERRVYLHKLNTIFNYFHYLQTNPKEIDLLLKELPIGVTSFFRDSETWNALKTEILPKLIANSQSGVLRAWIPACSTGEEAYSLAIIFQEVMNSIKPKERCLLQIFATDLSQDAIEAARKGAYSLSIVKDVQQEYLDRYFHKSENTYQINEIIRKMVVFAQHNVISDPPFTKLDIISCRNLFIYFNSELQQKLLRLFHYAMNPSAILLLGNAESIGNLTSLFSIINNKARIYEQIKDQFNKTKVEFPSISFSKLASTHYDNLSAATSAVNLELVVKELLINKYTPPAVVVNADGDILYISGRTGTYLEPAAGKADWNIHAMAHQGIREVLPAALNKVLRQQNTIRVKELLVITDGKERRVDIILQMIPNESSKIKQKKPVNHLVLIIFNEVALSITNTLKASKKSSKKTEQDVEDQEFQGLREEMQVLNKEWQFANEELQSSNEELQSSNEELTTSQEELQSLNEEVQSINTELTSKVEKLVWANNDINNLLNGTEVAAIFS